MPLPLHHPLGTERDLEIAALALEVVGDPVGRAGKDGGAEHQELAVGEMRQQIVDALLHDLARGIVEFVDRRPDGDDDRAGGGHAGRGVGEDQAVALERLHQHRLAVVFDERQAAGFQRLQHLAVDVVDVDAEARLGECQHQRDADVAAAADHRQVRRLRHWLRCGGSLRAGKIHALRSTAGSRIAQLGL